MQKTVADFHSYREDEVLPNQRDFAAAGVPILPRKERMTAYSAMRTLWSREHGHRCEQGASGDESPYSVRLFR
jgi:hypothetical protein